jgi:TDG/mug DNA glycosylase family protein
MRRSTGFPPIADDDARVLILGSLPSVRSIEAQEYYAHPQNAFWNIMGELFGVGRDQSYERRTRILKRNGLAVWDVLASSGRAGSMDSAIDDSSAAPNDFGTFLTAHPGIGLVCFNGKKAAGMFEQLVLPGHSQLAEELRFETLPSTSPAYASMSFEDKLRKWSIVTQYKSAHPAQ